jgi:hypothetical protein
VTITLQSSAEASVTITLQVSLSVTITLQSLCRNEKNSGPVRLLPGLVDFYGGPVLCNE